MCLGKTFADYVIKNTITGLIHSFDFEFVDKKYLKEWPINNIMVNKQIDVAVRITPKPIDLSFK